MSYSPHVRFLSLLPSLIVYFATILPIFTTPAILQYDNTNWHTQTNNPTTEMKYNYSEILRLSLLFYEAQRSGKLPEDNRISWRGDSALDDKGNNGEDLTGGYYDATDYVKFVWTQAGTSTILAWGLIEGYHGYKASGLLKQGLECLKWATDFLIKCHVAPDELYGQVGNINVDQAYWGRPEEMNMTRPAYKLDPSKPASDVAGEVSAALAAASIVFRLHGDNLYSDLCRQHAVQLYDFANNHRGLYHLSMKDIHQYYEYSCYGDELAWAAIWLYKATNYSKYLDMAENHYSTFRLKERPNEFSTGHRVAGVQALLAEATRRTEFKKEAQNFCDFQVNGQKRTPKGLLCIERFGALEHTANVAFLCMQVANLGISSKMYRNFAKQQIDYMLGDGGRSYVVGFGNNPPTQPHHVASSCPDPPTPCSYEDFKRAESNPQVLFGALVSGPSENDMFDDKRLDYIFTDVDVSFNAGFQGALAMLVDLHRRNVTQFSNVV